MTSKTEERMKIVVKEYLDEEQRRMEHDILEKVGTVFLWGFTCGVLFAYTSLTPLTIGLIGGYVLAKRELPLVDKGVLKVVEVLNRTQDYVFKRAT